MKKPRIIFFVLVGILLAIVAQTYRPSPNAPEFVRNFLGKPDLAIIDHADETPFFKLYTVEDVPFDTNGFFAGVPQENFSKIEYWLWFQRDKGVFDTSPATAFFGMDAATLRAHDQAFWVSERIDRELKLGWPAFTFKRTKVVIVDAIKSEKDYPPECVGQAIFDYLVYSKEASDTKACLELHGG